MALENDVIELTAVGPDGLNTVLAKLSDDVQKNPALARKTFIISYKNHAQNGQAPKESFFKIEGIPPFVTYSDKNCHPITATPKLLDAIADFLLKTQGKTKDEALPLEMQKKTLLDHQFHDISGAMMRDHNKSFLQGGIWQPLDIPFTPERARKDLFAHLKPAEKPVVAAIPPENRPNRRLFGLFGSRAAVKADSPQIPENNKKPTSRTP